MTRGHTSEIIFYYSGFISNDTWLFIQELFHPRNMSRILDMTRVIISNFKICYTVMNSCLGCFRGDCSYTIRDDGSGFVTPCLHPRSFFTNPWLTRVTCQCHVIIVIIMVFRVYIFYSFLWFQSFWNPPSLCVFLKPNIFNRKTFVCVFARIPYTSRSNKGSQSWSSTKSFDTR